MRDLTKLLVVFGIIEQIRTVNESRVIILALIHGTLNTTNDEILIAQFVHESNTFVSETTDRANSRNDLELFGEDAIEELDANANRAGYILLRSEGSKGQPTDLIDEMDRRGIDRTLVYHITARTEDAKATIT